MIEQNVNIHLTIYEDS